MKSNRTRWIATFACGAGLVFGAAALLRPANVRADDMKMDMKMDIIQTATGPGMQEVTTLVAAVKAAGLVDTLKGAGPFTVFAPTNAAFEKLPKGTVEDLLKPENKDKLVKILTYHVVPGLHDAKEVMGMTSAKTVEGADLKIQTVDGKVMINNATVIKPDIQCSNGVIHWIDTVLLPN